VQTAGVSINVPDSNDPVDVEYHKIMEDDDKALAEVDEMIRNNNSFAEKGGGAPNDTLNSRILKRIAPVKKEYEDFLERHPKHVQARIAYGSFLSETKDEDAAAEQWDIARQTDPKNPAPWNNLANVYGHHGPVKKAFEYYAKAIELNPNEAVYYQNMATTVYLFR